ncbi:MAG: thioesterase family protein [Solirubrobacteraceae bacterium]
MTAPATERLAAAPALEATSVPRRPSYEGSNIRTWIGFKHFTYLVEAAVLDWFRSRQLGPQLLYHTFGLGLEIVDCSIQLPALLEVDDLVCAEVAPAGAGTFAVRLRILRGERSVLGLRGKVTVALVTEAGAPGHAPPPSSLAELVTDGARAPELAAVTTIPLAGASAAEKLEELAGTAFRWDWRARYFHCHFSDRVQHSAYTRALEEVVDRFLADRGISIRTLLEDRGWIPVVSRARVQLAGDARMEELIHTTFVVDEILKDRAFDATMMCYVERGGELVAVARGTILHGYAASRGEHAGALVELDPEFQSILLGGGAR